MRASKLICAGCGLALPVDQSYPFSCPNAKKGDDIDHVVARILDPAQLQFPDENEKNPFLRYRNLFFSYHLSQAAGITESQYTDIVKRLNRAIVKVDGHGFSVTPFGKQDLLGQHLGFSDTGGLWVKDETNNVSGSHKARHFMGIMLYLEVLKLIKNTQDRPLAVASCGNAALAAAIVARAGDQKLNVFVPPDADPKVVQRLKDLGAHLTTCARTPGQKGDPCYLRFKEELTQETLPFSCQGSNNGLAIEGGETLGYELISQLREENIVLDRVFIQVGGGALASSCIQALREGVQLGVLKKMPKIHSVQTEGASPLARAYDLLAGRIAKTLGARQPTTAHKRAELIGTNTNSTVVQSEIQYAAKHRSEFMWPWEKEPKSIAHGILDDETYDWLEVVKGMIESGGYPITAVEPTVRKANDLARAHTNINVDHTGSSALAGLLQLREQNLLSPSEKVGLFFTGVRR
ncbi:MAG: pyridoxal-phosphate dependent enzyme [Pseudomonadota bacterium]